MEEEEEEEKRWRGRGEMGLQGGCRGSRERGRRWCERERWWCEREREGA